MSRNIQRAAFDEAIANMSMQTSPYFKDYVFYMHLLAQCKIVFTQSLQAAAGVSFKDDHYVLYLNNSEVIAEGTTEEGKHVKVLGFTEEMPIEHRIGILKHEMLHIALGHMLRVKDDDKDFKKYNIASDCALNQEIPREHLPDYVIYPDNIPIKKGIARNSVKNRQTAEYYYELVPDQEKNENGSGADGAGSDGSGSVCDTGNGIGTVDDHSVWQEIEGDPALQQEITKNMVERAGNETVKSAGCLPSRYSEMVENLTIRREVDWKQVLRRIVGNKKANVRKTLMRRDRRLPQANWLKGRTKDRVFELAVVSDVSGSVNNDALYALWGEIIHICELFNTPVNLVQIDTEAYKPEVLTKASKNVGRKGRGGTILSPAIDKLKEYNVKFDAMVVTTDGYLYNDGDVEPFRQLNIPVIWLVEENGQIMEEMNNGKMRAIKLSKEAK